MRSNVTRSAGLKYHTYNYLITIYLYNIIIIISGGFGGGSPPTFFHAAALSMLPQLTLPGARSNVTKRAALKYHNHNYLITIHSYNIIIIISGGFEGRQPPDILFSLLLASVFLAKIGVA